ncbi:MAG: hypothetical protein IJT21_02725 [Synergistaceae bacterium]|nr:hypothetical protein [Synergistaceae bacterium]
MKRFAVVLALVFAFAISAFAADFGAFTADVPAGWTAQQNGSTAIFTKDDGAGNITITVDETGGATIQQLAEAFAAEFAKSGFTDITTPTQDNEGDYSFDMKNPNGVESHALISVHENRYMLVTATGEGLEDDLVSILSTLAMK